MYLNKLLISGLAASQLLWLPQVQAANWLMLQGTEPSDSSGRAKLWGFTQFQYQNDQSDASAAGNYVPPKLIGPNLTSQSQFNVNRARIGARGVGFPLDSTINYFTLVEFGNNGITAASGTPHITDASITINRIPGARVRMGLFKTPGAEEGLQAIHVFDYINFTNVTNQLLLERVPNTAYTANAPATATPEDGSLSAFEQPVGAFRDTGVQVFDSFQTGDWEHSYALMLGNGNGLNFGDNDSRKDTYLYWSSEKVFSGKGPRVKSVKLFAWTQDGDRRLDNTDDGVYNPEFYSRTRSGIGAKYSKDEHRIGFEYITAKGMIFVGPDKPTFDINGAGPGGDGSDGEASGFYLDYGYSIPETNWQLDARYDELNRLEGDNLEMKFTTLTLGANYFFNKKSRVTINLENRDFNAPNFGSGAGPNANLDDVGQRFAIQLTHIF